jgi:hypothetical protein
LRYPIANGLDLGAGGAFGLTCSDNQQRHE